MTTQRNKTARSAETKQDKRDRLTDPALEFSVEEQRDIQASNATLQAGMSAARQQAYSNQKLQLTAEIRNLQKMKDRAARGYVESCRAGYDRTYQRLTRVAQVIADEFGETVTIPAYDPPINNLPSNVTTIKPRGAEARHAEGGYRETKGMGPSGKGGPLPGFPGSDANDAWLHVQGVTT